MRAVAWAALAACLAAGAEAKKPEVPLDYEYTKLRRMELTAAVEEMFDHAWQGYKRHAFPADELKPLTCTGSNAFGGFTLTVIDSLSVLITFGRVEEFAEMVQWLEENLTWNDAKKNDRSVSVFETNIRALGGLISAHLLAIRLLSPNSYSGSLLDLANRLGAGLLPAFDTPTGVPFNEINLIRGVNEAAGHATCPAAAGTLMLEFGLLGALTGKCEYVEVAYRAGVGLWGFRTTFNLLGSMLDIHSGKWLHMGADIGASHDSFFEYLVKSYVLFNDDSWLDIWHPAYFAAQVHLQAPGNLYVKANAQTAQIMEAQVNSLQAFWPGVLVMMGELEAAIISFRVFECMFDRFFLMPESVDIESATLRGRGYPLRPEMIESAWYLYQVTKDPHYLHFGERVLKRVNATARTKCGFAAVVDVSTLGLENKMDSYFLSETLKYLHLLLNPEEDPVLPLGKFEHVFNTEAHPIPIHSQIADRYHACLDPVKGGADGAEANDGRTEYPIARHFRYTKKLPAFFEGKFERHDKKKYAGHFVSELARQKKCAPPPHYMRVAHLIKDTGRCLPDEYTAHRTRFRAKEALRQEQAAAQKAADDGTEELRFDLRGTAAADVPDGDAQWEMVLKVPREAAVEHTPFYGGGILTGLTTASLGASEGVAVVLHHAPTAARRLPQAWVTPPPHQAVRAARQALLKMKSEALREFVATAAVLAGPAVAALIHLGASPDSVVATGAAAERGGEPPSLLDVVLLHRRTAVVLEEDACRPLRHHYDAVYEGIAVVLAPAAGMPCAAEAVAAHVRDAGAAGVVVIGEQAGWPSAAAAPAVPVVTMCALSGAGLVAALERSDRLRVSVAVLSGATLQYEHAGGGGDVDDDDEAVEAVHTVLYVHPQAAGSSAQAALDRHSPPPVEDHIAPPGLSPRARLRCALGVASRLAQRVAAQVARGVVTAAAEPVRACEEVQHKADMVTAQVMGKLAKLFHKPIPEAHVATFRARVMDAARAALCLGAASRVAKVGASVLTPELAAILGRGGAPHGYASESVADTTAEAPAAAAAWPLAGDVTDDEQWTQKWWERTSAPETPLSPFEGGDHMRKMAICGELPVHAFVGSRALFGRQVGRDGTRVRMAKLARVGALAPDNPNGCGKYSGALADAAAGRTVVVPRGGCSFHMKARMAEAAGAVAVLITSRSEGAPETMSDYPGDAAVGLPLAMLSADDGDVLAALLDGADPDAYRVSLDDAQATDGTIDLLYSDVAAADTPLGLAIWAPGVRPPPAVLYSVWMEPALRTTLYLDRRRGILQAMAEAEDRDGPADHNRHGQRPAAAIDRLPREGSTVVIAPMTTDKDPTLVRQGAEFIHEYDGWAVGSWTSALDALRWVAQHEEGAAMGVVARLYHQPVAADGAYVVMTWYDIHPRVERAVLGEAMDDVQGVVERLEGYLARELVDLTTDHVWNGHRYSWVDLTLWRSQAAAVAFTQQPNTVPPSRAAVEAMFRHPPARLQGGWHSRTAMPQHPLPEGCTQTWACGGGRADTP